MWGDVDFPIGGWPVPDPICTGDWCPETTTSSCSGMTSDATLQVFRDQHPTVRDGGTVDYIIGTSERGQSRTRSSTTRSLGLHRRRLKGAALFRRNNNMNKGMMKINKSSNEGSERKKEGFALGLSLFAAPCSVGRSRTACSMTSEGHRDAPYNNALVGRSGGRPLIE